MTGTTKRLIILGAGGHGRVVADIAQQQGFSDIAFVDAEANARRQNLRWPIIGRSFSVVAGEYCAFVAIGDNLIRLQRMAELTAKGILLPTLIHHSAVVSTHTTIGAGSVVMPQVVINVGTRLGSGVIANSGCTIDHDCVIGDGVHISPGANLAGGVNVGACSWVGIGACVREGISIGRGAMVGAGGVVVSAVADGATVFGVPARVRGS